MPQSLLARIGRRLHYLAYRTSEKRQRSLLWLLASGPKDPRELASLEGGVRSAGTIYLELSWMQSEGLVAEASEGGPGLYEVTSKGRALLVN